MKFFPNSIAVPEIQAADSSHIRVVKALCDAGMLDISLQTIQTQTAADNVLIAVDADRIIGTCVLVPREGDLGAHIEALAVRRRRQGQGIGSALVRAASNRYETLTADFSPHLRDFYEALDFTVIKAGENRYRGILRP